GPMMLAGGQRAIGESLLGHAVENAVGTSIGTSGSVQDGATKICQIDPMLLGNETGSIAQHFGNSSEDFLRWQTSDDSPPAIRSEETSQSGQEPAAQAIVRERWSASDDLLYHDHDGGQAHGHNGLSWSDALDVHNGPIAVAVGID